MIKAFLKTYHFPITIFIASRVMIFLALYITQAFGVPNTLNNWDSLNYLAIVDNGYQFFGDYTTDEGKLIAFFPLYPMLVRALDAVLPGSSFYSGLVLSFIFSFAAVVLLYRLVMDWKGEQAAKTAVALLVFFPTSVFLSAAYTEGLFLFLTLLTLYLWKRNKEEWTIIPVALSTVTRITGSILGLLFMWQLWKKTRNIFKVITYSLVAGIPFYIFLYFQYNVYGTPFAFMEVQQAHWQQYGVFPWVGLWLIISRALTVSEYAYMWRLDLIYLIVMIVTLVLSYKKVPRIIWYFGAGVVTLTLCSSLILGMGRYMLLVLPFYFFWGLYLSERKWLAEIVVPCMACLMIVITILFSLSKHIF